MSNSQGHACQLKSIIITKCAFPPPLEIPIGLIVFGLIDFSKSVASGDEKDGKKNLNLFIKRLIYGALVFCVPWIVNVVMHLLGDLTKDVNWTDCYNNANKEYIDAHEEQGIFFFFFKNN